MNKYEVAGWTIILVAGLIACVIGFYLYTTIPYHAPEYKCVLP